LHSILWGRCLRGCGMGYKEQSRNYRGHDKLVQICIHDKRPALFCMILRSRPSAFAIFMIGHQSPFRFVNCPPRLTHNRTVEATTPRSPDYGVCRRTPSWGLSSTTTDVRLFMSPTLCKQLDDKLALLQTTVKRKADVPRETALR
jgi:hypothetical protein